MTDGIPSLRRDYGQRTLNEGELAADPLTQFRAWFSEAETLDREANAMTLATVDAEGQANARIVLLKGVSDEGFVFFTDYRSQKAAELGDAANAALVFWWPGLERQVRIRGPVTRVPREETEAYFGTRPRGSRIGAWASHQSSVIPDRAVLEAEVKAVENRFADGDVPPPPLWGGFRVHPVSVEFWQGRENRLHDRLRYRRDGEGWIIERLSP